MKVVVLEDEIVSETNITIPVLGACTTCFHSCCSLSTCTWSAVSSEVFLSK